MYHFVLLLLMMLVQVNQVDQQMRSLFRTNQVDSLICFYRLISFSSIEKPSFLDLHGVKDITVKAGKDFEVHIPYKATPKPQAQWLVEEKDLVGDDRVNLKVRSTINFFRFDFSLV